ncbi:MAG: hypothetical protein M1828_003385 [Chrysothrix sp. TS-e1954]|nr:MAG: hypothetical protein M1828_003385 [Chrysothrix sp. TS-e1954]
MATSILSLILLTLIFSQVGFCAPPSLSPSPGPTDTFVDPPDQYIVCLGPPPPIIAGWPAFRYRADYKDNYQLCATAAGRPHHLGCFCGGPAGPPSCGLEFGADAILLNSPLNFRYANGFTTFLDWCKAHCLCMSQELHDLGTRHQQLASSLSTPDLRDYWKNTTLDNPDAGSLSFVGGDGSASTRVDLTGNTAGGSTGNDNPVSVGVDAVEHFLDACPANQTCYTQTDCPNRGSCACSIVSGSYLPRLNQMVYNRGCLSPELSVKRAEAMPCACNGTYVSHACCNTEEGLVWERPEMKLGELAEAHGLQ